eukprot:TRINITY_DN7927_c0_g1_i1.p1 TRINITY_DN7927_c0_g1~~TRINITY_DN7927_c0_g1_i1.p1  ORF type:complete len:282 (+),score=90.72 TRINITY_DN7927_c0_g1_i1:103-846(+)
MMAEDAKQSPTKGSATSPTATGAADVANPFGSGQELNFLDGAEGASGAPGEDGGSLVTPASNGLLGHAAGIIATIRDLKGRTLRGMRAWTEFAQYKEFSVPKRGEIISRVTTNCSYYKSNYMCIIAILAAWTALANLFFVVSMALTVLAYYYYKHQTKDGQSLVVAGREIPSVQFYAGLTGTSLFLFWLSGGSSTMFWLLASTAVTIGGHAATREPVDQLTLARVALEEGPENSVDATFNTTFGHGV